MACASAGQPAQRVRAVVVVAVVVVAAVGQAATTPPSQGSSWTVSYEKVACRRD